MQSTSVQSCGATEAKEGSALLQRGRRNEQKYCSTTSLSPARPD